MSWFDGLRHRLVALLRRRRYEAEMRDEFAFHQALETMQQSPHHETTGAARDAARRRFGNSTRIVEETRQMAGFALFDTMGQDLRYAWRSFSRTPAFSAVVILTLAVGIGANVAIFSAVDALLLRPLPFSEPERLVKLSLVAPPRGDDPGNQDMEWSYPKFDLARSRQTAFAAMGLHLETQYTLFSDGDAERDEAEVVDAGYFEVLGLQPVLGRIFTADEDRHPGRAQVLIVGDAFWRRRFNADPGVLGKSVTLDGKVYTLIGVLPPGFKGLSGKADLFTPVMAFYPNDLNQPWNHLFGAIGRLRPGVSQAQAASQLGELGRQIDQTFPVPDDSISHWGARAIPLDAGRVDPVMRQSLLVLLGAVGLLLMIACANVANLVLLRSSGRSRELALRQALGASRGRILRQLLTESVVLGVAGGVVGLAVAWLTLRGLLVAAPQIGMRGDQGGLGLVNFDTVHLDRAALAFTALVAIGTGVLFGLVPAFTGSTGGLADSLKAGALQNGGTGRRASSSRYLLVVTEIALALVLLAGSGLLLKSLARLLAVDPGVVADRILTVRITPGQGLGRDSLPVFYDEALQRLGAIPGVRSVGLADCPPLNGGCSGTSIALRDRPAAPAGSEPNVGVHWISPSWPETVHLPLIEGRQLDRHDRLGAPKAVLVSQAAALQFWPGQDPLGKGVSVGQGGFWQDTALVVGVVGDVRYANLHTAPQPDVYLSYYQSPRSRIMIYIRTAGDPLAIAAGVRRELKAIAPDVPVYDLETLSSRLEAASASTRLSTELLSAFALIALGLAIMGAYGIIAYGVAQRRQEIGIRMALGATARDVVGMVVRQGMMLAVAGTAVGLVIAISASRVLTSLLYDTTASDPATFALMVGTLLLAVVLASWLPARRAARIEPTEALRG